MNSLTTMLQSNMLTTTPHGHLSPHLWWGGVKRAIIEQKVGYWSINWWHLIIFLLIVLWWGGDATIKNEKNQSENWFRYKIQFILYKWDLWNELTKSDNSSYLFGWLVGWFVGFYGISTFIGYLMPNPFLCK